MKNHDLPKFCRFLLLFQLFGWRTLRLRHSALRDVSRWYMEQFHRPTSKVGYGESFWHSIALEMRIMQITNVGGGLRKGLKYNSWSRSFSSLNDVRLFSTNNEHLPTWLMTLVWRRFPPSNFSLSLSKFVQAMLI